jgi:flagellar biosynthetic protein FlhB
MSDSSAEDRTLAPTERRIERFRRAGQVAVSRELIAGCVAAAVCAVLVVGGKAAVGGLCAYLGEAMAGALDATAPWQAMRSGLLAMLATLWLPLGTACAVAVLAGLVQTRGNLAGGSLRPEGERIRPRLGRLLPRDRVADLVLDLGKLGLLCVVVGWCLAPCLATVARLPGAGVERIVTALGVLVQRLAACLAVAMVGLGLADYLLQARRRRARLRMTPEEARREHKASEGAPEHRAERQRLYRELHEGAALGELRGAEMVLVDPGRSALAVAYAGGAGDAPVLVARGERLLAYRIETAAQLGGVPVLVAPELVRALAGVAVGDEIPESTYAAMAEMMVRARSQRRGARAWSHSTPAPSESPPRAGGPTR